MKFEDDSQNLRLRLRVIQVIVIVLLATLGTRLYFLQVVNGAYYAERAENQRVRRLPIPAQRGTIFDRNGKILVDSRPTYNVILSREEMKGREYGALAQPLSAGLGVDEEVLRERFDELARQPAFESIIIKQNATPADIAWVETHQGIDHPELRIEQQPQRRYLENGVLAHVLGYVGEVNPKQLEHDDFKKKALKPGDIIGQEGIESTYDSYLRGIDGYREVIVDSRGQIQDTIKTVEPQPGQDLVTTIDLDLQLVAEEQLRNSPNGRGVIIALNPNNGEILSLASAPTFDPNLFSQNVKTKEVRQQIGTLFRDPKTPMVNRAISGRYPPGSTWKIPMSVAGLEQGAISVKNSHLVCGGGIQIGNKFTRCMGSHGSPDIVTAIRVSCDGYFYRLGLKMGIDGIQKMVSDFDLNRRTGIDLPHELISWTPSREFKKRMNPRDPDWRDIDTVYASFGQVYDVVTPIALVRTIAGIAVGGKFYVPHLLKELKETTAVGDPNDAETFRKLRPAMTFDEVYALRVEPQRPNPKLVDISDDNHRTVVEGMWQVVNNGGTGTAVKIDGMDIAGKTGTAQVVSLGKDVGANKDHSWFVSYAPAFKPEIATVALIENVGFGGKFAAPATRQVYEAFYHKAPSNTLPVVQQIAKNSDQRSEVRGQSKPRHN
ncbi:MAG: penicillin-binding protein 2 [Acidobacteriota bacterium]|jgi:penicillin-binding protein 2|nr:penicillin-binding protein 2 [Acidobacteriota bacterium]